MNAGKIRVYKEREGMFRGSWIVDDGMLGGRWASSTWIAAMNRVYVTVRGRSVA